MCTTEEEEEEAGEKVHDSVSSIVALHFVEMVLTLLRSRKKGHPYSYYKPPCNVRTEVLNRFRNRKGYSRFSKFPNTGQNLAENLAEHITRGWSLMRINI